MTRATAPIEPPAAVGMPAELLDIRAVAALLGGCSIRHVRRMADAGLMPRPLKLVHLIRWRRSDLDAWIAAGCPRQQSGGPR